MMTANRKVAGVLCCAALVCGVTGCSGGKENASSTIGPETLKTSGYPLNTDETLTLWMRHNVGRSVEGYDSPNDYPRVAEMQKRTGVTLNIQYADLGMEEEQFNALLASENLPDMIYYDWMNIPGGADQAIRDNYIISLNDVMKDYSPNFCKYMEENPTFSKMSRTDSGNFYMYPSYEEWGEEAAGGTKWEASGGYVMRKDWLDELNLQPPETIDEWHTVLTAFKERKHATAPFSESYFDKVFSQGMLAVYGLSSDFYKQGEQVLYGPGQPAYRQYLTQMNRWYQEGLVNENIISADYATLQDNMQNGDSGVAFAWLGAGMGTWIQEGKKIDPNYDLIGLKPPVLEKGTVSPFGLAFLPVSSMGIAISSASKKQELAAKFLDYGYSEEGGITYNFGIEGISFERVNGRPNYIIPPEDIDRSDFLTLYTFSSGNWAKRGSQKIREFYYTMPQQQQAAEAFVQVQSNAEYLLPPISPSIDEAAEIGQLERTITRYAEDMRNRFIVGTEPIENFDAYLQELNQLGLPRLLELKQAALDRYNRR